MRYNSCRNRGLAKKRTATVKVKLNIKIPDDYLCDKRTKNLAICEVFR